ncbi:MAG: hypothetical protein V4466_08340 [Pseudomonadota bacterium]
MSRLLAIAGVIVGVSLGSCAYQADDSTGFAWSFQDSVGEGPKLAYGAPASDNVVLMMTCNPGAETVNLSLLGGSPRDGLILVSDDGRQTFKGEAVAAPGMGHMVEAEAHLTAEPLAGFEQTGRLSLVDRGRTANLDASPVDRAGVTRFFEACRA